MPDAQRYTPAAPAGAGRGALLGWAVAAVIALATLAGALALVRWFAPQLIGLPVDLRLVQASDTVPPFFDGVFRAEDHAAGGMLLPDPATVVRPRPGLADLGVFGPNDLLGFRNLSVPVVADVLVIGDSQSYGNGVLLEHTWPQRVQEALRGHQARVYSMASSGWGAAQYVEMGQRAPVFEPQVIVVAFYTGNDPLESFRVAYGMQRFEDMRSDPSLDPGDMPSVRYPAPEEEHWPVVFSDGVRTVFTSRLRLESNRRTPVVDAGYAAMVLGAREIRRLTAPQGAGLLFTIIPTKELVYAAKVENEGLDAPADYRELVAVERARVAELARALGAVEGAGVVDVLEPLERAALAGEALYATSADGHPSPAGHAVIAAALAAALAPRVQPRPRGLLLLEPVRLPDGSPGVRRLYLAREDGLWRFPDFASAQAAGWRREDVRTVPPRAVAGLLRRGDVPPEHAARFGPSASR